MMTWAEVDGELASARHWRRGGNEGRARVCARRAAGWAVGIYRQAQGQPVDDDNAYQALRWLQGAEDVDVDVRAAALRLATRVREDFSYPFEEDPIEDAARIVAALRA